jgi:choline dehydrogenase-like flavoprotein
MRRLFGHALAVKAVGECLPHPGSYVDLDPERRDELGVPLARIHSHLDDTAVRRHAFMARKAREIVRAAGVEKIVEEHGTYDMFNASYVMGTCRMGRDPRDSVVDRDCRSHRWKNLLVVDGSVFPSSGGGEAPSLTIQAVALRAAQALRGRRGPA